LGFSLALAVLVGAPPPLHPQHLLRLTLTVGTLAEMLMWAGFFWIPKTHRRLPLWSISRVVSRFFFTRPAMNGLLSVAAAALLLLSLFIADGWQALVAASLVFLAAAFAVDIWRACYLHYWFMGLSCLLLPGTAVALRIILGSLYFWAGFFKLTSPLFHSNTSLFTFKRVFDLLRVAPGSPLQYAISVCAVTSEMAMGAAFLAHELLPAALLHAFALFNFSMHAYIVVCIGLENGIHTFVPWNAMCVALSALLFGQRHPDVQSALPLHPHHFLLLILLHTPPILQILGKNEYGTLSHSWFVPSASGACFLLVPSHISGNIPPSENGLPIRRLRDATLQADAVSHILDVKSDAAELFGPGTRSAAAQQLVQRSVVLDDSWVMRPASPAPRRLTRVLRSTFASGCALTTMIHTTKHLARGRGCSGTRLLSISAALACCSGNEAT
jgi:hypothetical protein